MGTVAVDQVSGQKPPNFTVGQSGAVEQQPRRCRARDQVDQDRGAGQRLDGAMPGATAFLLYGACPLPVPIACGLGAVRVFDGFVPEPINATGSAQLNIPIAGVPAGVQFTLQWVFKDPLQPCGWVFTDALTLTVGLP